MALDRGAPAFRRDPDPVIVPGVCLSAAPHQGYWHTPACLDLRRRNGGFAELPEQQSGALQAIKVSSEKRIEHSCVQLNYRDTLNRRFTNTESSPAPIKNNDPGSGAETGLIARVYPPAPVI